MCQLEVTSVSSRLCAWISEEHSAHVWKKFTYMICEDAVEGGYTCRNIEETEVQTDSGAGSTTLHPCRVCDQTTAADRMHAEALERAREEYDRAIAAAYREERRVTALRTRADAETKHQHRRRGPKRDKSREGRSSTGGKYRSTYGGETRDDRRY